MRCDAGRLAACRCARRRPLRSAPPCAAPRLWEVRVHRVGGAQQRGAAHGRVGHHDRNDRVLQQHLLPRDKPRVGLRRGSGPPASRGDGDGASPWAVVPTRMQRARSRQRRCSPAAGPGCSVRCGAACGLARPHLREAHERLEQPDGGARRAAVVAAALRLVVRQQHRLCLWRHRQLLAARAAHERRHRACASAHKVAATAGAGLRALRQPAAVAGLPQAGPNAYTAPGKPGFPHLLRRAARLGPRHVGAQHVDRPARDRGLLAAAVSSALRGRSSRASSRSSPGVDQDSR